MDTDLAQQYETDTWPNIIGTPLRELIYESLDVDYHYTYNAHGGWDLDGITLLLACGGPSQRLHVTDETVTLRTSWGSTVTAVSAPTPAEWVESLREINWETCQDLPVSQII